MDEVIKKIVLVMVGLAVLGCIMAGVHYFAIDLPIQQAALHPPSNAGWRVACDCTRSYAVDSRCWLLCR